MRSDTQVDNDRDSKEGKKKKKYSPENPAEEHGFGCSCAIIYTPDVHFVDMTKKKLQFIFNVLCIRTAMRQQLPNI